MRRRFASLLLAAMLTLTAVAEDLGEPIPEVEPAAEEIYEETETATESEDPEEDDAGTEETISAAETIAENVETTEEVSESGEVDEKVETDSGDGTVYSETGTDDTELETVGSDDTDCGTDNDGSETEDEIQELGRDVSSEETEGVIGDSDLAGTEGDAELDGGRDTVYGDAEVTESEVEEEVIVVESEPIVIESEPIVIGETESEVIEEPMMMAPMMVGASFLGATRDSSSDDPDMSRPNDFGGSDYSISGHKYESDDYRRYGFDYYIIPTGYRSVLYKEDASNTETITFVPRIRDDTVQFSMSVNGKTVEKSGLFGKAKVFSITYADLYDALESGTCSVTIHCHSNACRDYEWFDRDALHWSAGWYYRGIYAEDVDQTWTFTKYDYSKDFSNDTHSVSLTSDKTECYPGDTVIFTASATALRESTNVNDQYTISYTYVVNGAEYKNEGTVFMYTAGTESITCYVVAYFTPKISS